MVAKIERIRTRLAAYRYRVDPSLSSLTAWLYPGTAFIPSTFTLNHGGAISFSRVFLVLALLLTLREFVRKIAHGAYVAMGSDLMVPLTVGWMLFTLYLHQGPKGLVGYGAVSAIEFLAAYLVARVNFGSPVGFERFIDLMRVLVVLIMLTAALDSVTGVHFLHQLGYKLTGGISVDLPPVYRFGIIRAHGAIEHPILLGIFLVISALLFYYSQLSQREKVFSIGLAVAGLVLPLSSAPVLSLLISGAVIAAMRMLKRYPWRLVIPVTAMVYCTTAFFVLVDHPLTTLIQNLTFDPQTGMFRMQIWEWVGVNVQHSPWIGIGFDDWERPEEMPSSIDSLYLIQTIRYGVPALVLFLLSLFSTGFNLSLKARRIHPSPVIGYTRFGLGLIIAIFAFNAFTVHMWGTLWCLLAIVLGCRAGLTESLYLPPEVRADDQLRPRSR